MTIKQLTWTTLVVWFAAIFVLGTAGTFVQAAGVPPLRILIGVILPIVVFLAAYYGSRTFRAFVLSADLALFAGLQAWRMVGFGFFALYSHDLLPGLFTWPAAVGDIAIAAMAPWIAVALSREQGYVCTRRFALWNAFGILDLVIAVSIGAFSSGYLSGFTGGVTTAPMSHMPLVLIPAYFLPLFIMLHLIALLKRRSAVGERRPGVPTMALRMSPAVR